MELLLGLFITIGFYVIPMIIAIINKKKDVVAISLVNILLGWSIIGWAIALIWAVKSDNKEHPIIMKEEKDEFNSYMKLEKLNVLKQKGIISNEEFEIEKRKLLK